MIANALSIRAVFLDMGNTLVGDPRSEIWTRLAHRFDADVVRALRAADQQIDDEFVSHFLGDPRICARALEILGKPASEQRVAALLAAFEEAAFAAYRERKELVALRGTEFGAVLESLRAMGIATIGVISNERAGNPERFLRDVIGIDQRSLAPIVASGEVGVGKPDRRIFEVALQRAGTDPQSAMHVGDSVSNDIAPALALGLRAAQCSRFVRDSKGVGLAPYIDDLRELSSLIAHWPSDAVQWRAAATDE